MQLEALRPAKHHKCLKCLFTKATTGKNGNIWERHAKWIETKASYGNFTSIGKNRDCKAFSNFVCNSFNEFLYLMNKTVSFASHQIFQLTLCRAPMLLCAPSPWPLKNGSVCHWQQQHTRSLTSIYSFWFVRKTDMDAWWCLTGWWLLLIHHLCVFTYTCAKQVSYSRLTCWYPLAYWESQSRTSTRYHKRSWSLIVFPN